VIDFKHMCCRTEVSSERSNRALDLVLLGLLAPPVFTLIVVLSIVILALQGRPIFYKSPRHGISGRMFMLVKFRSMTPLAPLQETSPEMQCYVTPLGSFLRRTSLDELPQIFHVITGTMSFHRLGSSERPGFIVGSK
jgi:lipopolysaccharide/colanic/teichoic acid biosynthesis glycosyltransferase